MSVEIFDSMLRASVAGSFAILVVLALRGVLRRVFGAQLAYSSWLLVPTVAFVMLLPAPTRPIENFIDVARIAAAASTPRVPAAAAVDPRALLLLLWSLGAGLAAIGFIVQQRRYLRGLGRLAPVSGARVVRSQSEFGGPALVGMWRARIVLPADFEARYSLRQRELILAHENVHLARGDAWANALVAVLRCLNWFNPLLHYAAAKFRLDQELACDAAVIARFPQARRPYADAMLKVQLAGQSRRDLQLPVGCRWPSEQNLKQRILLLKRRRPARATRLAGLGLVTSVTLLFAYGAWASQSPRLQPRIDASEHRQVEVALRIDVDGESGTPLRLIQPFGKSFEIAYDTRYRAQFTANLTATGSITLEGWIRSGDRLLSSPWLELRPGEPFSFSLDDGPGEIVRIEGTLGFAESPQNRQDRDESSAMPKDAPATVRPATPSPLYPPEAVKDRIEGTVYVATTIAADGAVQAARIDHVEPPTSAAALGPAALAAVKTWRFDPARADGRAVASETVVPIGFFLQDTSVPVSVGQPTLKDATVLRGSR